MNRSLFLGLIVGSLLTAGLGHWLFPATSAADKAPPRTYVNKLTPLADPKPLLADWPQYVEPVRELRRFEAPLLVDDASGNLDVRAWRFSYNARGIVEMPNRLQASATAVIVVHPWSVDDEWGWKTPEPAGVVDFCTPEKNTLAYKHTREVVDPFLKRLRAKVGLVGYSLIGPSDPLRRKAYRNIHERPTEAVMAEARKELKATLAGYKYTGETLPERLSISAERPVADYFRQFPGLDAGPRFNGKGYWQLPVAVSTAIDTAPDDVLFFDQDGYPPLRDFMKKQGIRHVLLTGYATDMCFCKTTAGYENLSKDFNVFLVGDATLATFPANDSPRMATNAHISFASLEHLITQTGWVRVK